MPWRLSSGIIEAIIVVDFGTATTFDYVSPRGEYREVRLPRDSGFLPRRFS